MLKRCKQCDSCLQKSGIPVPLHIIVDRDNLPEGQADPTGFVETEDYVELNGEPQCVHVYSQTVTYSKYHAFMLVHLAHLATQDMHRVHATVHCGSQAYASH